jgi:hypothetical protein
MPYGFGIVLCVGVGLLELTTNLLQVLPTELLHGPGSRPVPAQAPLATTARHLDLAWRSRDAARRRVQPLQLVTLDTTETSYGHYSSPSLKRLCYRIYAQLTSDEPAV